MLCAGNILPAGQEGSRFQFKARARVQAGSRPKPEAEAARVGMKSIRINTEPHSTASTGAVRVDGSHNDNIHGQILINLRRLGHQIKPAKSWLPLLERMLIEGLHCPER